VTACPLPRYTLLCPGPVNVGRRVAEVACQCALSHREESFCTLLRTVQQDLLHIAGIDPATPATALVLTGSGTAANEAVLASAVAPETTVVVLTNGAFGEQLAAIAATYNRTVVLDSGWGEKLDLTRLARLLAENPRVMVAMVHHETSTGLLNPVAEVANLCRRHRAQLFVDAVSSFAADPISLADGGITFLTTSSGMAIASFPGLSFVLGRTADFARLGDYPVRNHYLNLSRHFQAATEDGQTPDTPAVSLITTLKVSLAEIRREGFDRRYRRLCGLAMHMRQQLAARGLYQAAARAQSVVLTNARLPRGLLFPELQRQMKEQGFVIYDAKGPLRGKFFQVSTIGDITRTDIDRFFAALDRIAPPVFTEVQLL
jgi:2-aminoethylphosphonate-pyruvate transaminase